MSVATVPRVRTMVICDEAVSSEIEAEVHTLENVRLRIVADSYPHFRQFCIYLVFSHSQAGVFEGELRFVRESSKATMDSQAFTLEFNPGMDRIAMYVETGECRFPASGDYAFQVWFLDENSKELQKGDEKLEVHTSEIEA